MKGQTGPADRQVSQPSLPPTVICGQSELPGQSEVYREDGPSCIEMVLREVPGRQRMLQEGLH